MAESEANRFIEKTLERITHKYRQIATERVYSLLSDVSLGTPSPALSELETEFVVETLHLIRGEFSRLTTGEIQLALGRVAQETDRARRVGGGPKPEPAAKAATKQSGRRSEVSTGYVRAERWAYVRAWDAANATLELRFESEEDLTQFCMMVARNDRFDEELNPAPPEFGALTVIIGLGAQEDPVSFAASAIKFAGSQTTLDIPHLPPRLRKVAAQQRAKISSAHSSVATPTVDPAGLNNTAARDAVPSKPKVSDVSKPRAPRTGEHGRVATGRRRALRTGQVSTTPPTNEEHAPTGFEVVPTDGGQRETTSIRTDPRRTAARRRRARAQLRTGNQPIEDELKRFGRRTGRRTRARNNRLPADEPSLDVSDVTPEEFAERMPSGIVNTKTHPIAARTQTKRATVPPAEEAPKAPPRQATPAPSTDATSADRTPPPPAPTEPNRRPPSISVSDFGVQALEVGAHVGRKDGREPGGGAAAILLMGAAEFPASIVSLRTETRTWKLAIREELALQIEAMPPDPKFTMESAVAMSGLVEPNDIAEAASTARETGDQITDILVRNRKLLYRQIDAITSARAQLMFSAIFSEEVISFAIVGYESIDARGSTAVPMAAAAWQHLKKITGDLDQSELEEQLGAHYADRPSFVRDGYINELTLRLNSKELKFVSELLDGNATVAQATAKSPMRRRPSLALVVALDRIGLLRWTKVQTSSTRIKRIWSVVEAKVRDLDNDLNPFEILEAHWSSDEKLLGESYAALCRMLDLDYIEANGNPEESQLATELRQRLTDTRARLAERAERHKYRCAMVDAFNRKNAVMLYEKQAELALFKGDYVGAEDSLRRVVEMAPHHPTAPPQLRAVVDAIAKKNAKS